MKLLVIFFLLKLYARINIFKNKKANKIEKYHVASYKQILRVKKKN